jgi:hypothetical protein
LYQPLPQQPIQLSITVNMTTDIRAAYATVNGPVLDVVTSVTVEDTRIQSIHSTGTGVLKIQATNDVGRVDRFKAYVDGKYSQDFAPMGLRMNGPVEIANCTNLVTYSEDFTDADWTKIGFGVTVTADVTAAPDGNQTADSMYSNFSGGGQASGVERTLTVGIGSIIGSIYVKQGAQGDWCALYLTNNSNANGVRQYFDIGTGVLGTSVTVGTGNFFSPTITSVGDSWYRLSVGIPTSTTDSFFLFREASGDTLNDAVAGDEYFIWGAQVENATSVGGYCRTDWDAGGHNLNTTIYYG